MLKFVLITLLPVVCSCSSAETKPSERDPHQAESEVIHRLFGDLNTRIQSLEAKLSSINEKLDTTRAGLDRTPSSQTGKPSESTSEAVQPAGTTKPTSVIAHPSSSFGTSNEAPQAAHDPESGFVNDEAVQIFRKAMILFQGQKYPEAVLIFSDFLEKFPDHALAGSAQFYVGEAYFKQKEYKLAIQEFQRVLTSYDRSPHVADTLNEMAIAEDAVKKPNDAAKHRHLLTSLFPQSPALGSQPSIPELNKTTHTLDTPPVVATESKSTSTLDLPPTAPLTAPISEDKENALFPSADEAPLPNQ